MKNIFKKNQIIIVALAIMIIIAGYLNYSGKNNDDETNIAGFDNGEVVDYDTNEDTADDKDIDSALVSLLDGEEDVATEDTESADGEVTEAADGEDTEVADGEDADAVATTTDGEKTDEAADASEEDEQLAVSDTGEVIVENNSDAPGEAVLVSTTIPANYFASAQLAREQLRAKNKATYNEIINNVNVSEEDRTAAVNSLISQTKMSEKEFKTETLLEAKGFSDAIVTISDNNVEVIINAATITEQDIAQIQDIVTRNTEIDVSDVVITPVVKEE